VHNLAETHIREAAMPADAILIHIQKELRETILECNFSRSKYGIRSQRYREAASRRRRWEIAIMDYKRGDYQPAYEELGAQHFAARNTLEYAKQFLKEYAKLSEAEKDDSFFYTVEFLSKLFENRKNEIAHYRKMLGMRIKSKKKKGPPG
jgi:hypothetical protein